MKCNYNNIITIILLFACPSLYSKDSDTTDVKTDWGFGGLPVVSYNSDLGLQYGAVLNLYHYGNGDIYPSYYHSLYLEASMYTKGSGIFRAFYDTKELIPNIRTSFDVCYLPDQALDFYGFNGYQAVYNKNWIDDDQSDYKTRVFYKHKRNIMRTKFDFQGKTGIENINWTAGLNLQNYKISSVDIDKLNKGKSEEKILPDTATLFDLYQDWGIIKKNETNGGFFTSIKAGIVYDTRNNERFPTKGFWSEVVFSQTLNTDFNFTNIGVTHRQYFTLIENKLSFAYRFGYQGIIAGNAPFYALPTVIYSFTRSSSSDGMGGSKTVRGIVQNRVVGKGMTMGNLELRWKFASFTFKKQDIYLALNPFIDYGQVVVEYTFDKSGIDPTINKDDYFKEGAERPHITYGCGLKVALNYNFIVSADVGLPLDSQDGNMGIYIGMNWLF